MRVHLRSQVEVVKILAPVTEVRRYDDQGLRIFDEAFQFPCIVFMLVLAQSPNHDWHNLDSWVRLEDLREKGKLHL